MLPLEAVLASQILRIQQRLRQVCQPVTASPRVCHGCRVRPIQAGERLCARCAYSRSYAARSKKSYEAGACADCHLAPAEPGVTRCADCREKHNAKRREERQAQQQAKLAARLERRQADFFAQFTTQQGRATHAQA